jgi:hypothetical protein
MNAHTITPDMIRRRPFANAATALMTPADEAWIAADMARTVQAEQRARGKTPGGTPGGHREFVYDEAKRNEAKQPTTGRAARNAEILATRRAAILEALSGEEITVSRLLELLADQQISMSYEVCKKALNQLRKERAADRRLVCLGARRQVALWKAVQA